MKRTLIRYKAKPEMAGMRRRADRRGVCGTRDCRAEWRVRYLSLRLDDDSFIHFVETEASDGSSFAS